MVIMMLYLYTILTLFSYNTRTSPASVACDVYWQHLLHQYSRAYEQTPGSACVSMKCWEGGWKQLYHHKANKYKCMLFYWDTLQFGMSSWFTVQNRLHIILWHNTFIHDRQNTVSFFHRFVTDHAGWLACAHLHHTYKATSLKHQ